MTETSVLRELSEELDLTPSGGAAVPDRVDVPVSFPVSEKPTREQFFPIVRVLEGAQDLSHWTGDAAIPLDGQLGVTVRVLRATGPLVCGGRVRVETLG